MSINAIESEFCTSKMADRSEMARNAIESDFRTSKMAAEKKEKFCIDLKWPKLLSNEFQTSKMADRSEMARNAIKSDFRTSKMSTGGHFVKKIKKIQKSVLIKWLEMRSKVNFGHPKWPTAAILSKISKKSCVSI